MTKGLAIHTPLHLATTLSSIKVQNTVNGEFNVHRHPLGSARNVPTCSANCSSSFFITPLVVTQPHNSVLQSDLSHQISDTGSQWCEPPSVTRLFLQCTGKRNEPGYEATSQCGS